MLTCSALWNGVIEKCFKQISLIQKHMLMHGQALSNGAFSKSIAPMVRELQVSNKQNNNNKTKWAVLAVSVLNVRTIPK